MNRTVHLYGLASTCTLLFALPDASFANWWIVRSSDKKCLVVDIEPTGVTKSERSSNVQEHNLPVARQGRRGCCPLLCCNLYRQRGRCRAPCDQRLPGRKGGRRAG